MPFVLVPQSKIPRSKIKNRKSTEKHHRRLLEESLDRAHEIRGHRPIDGAMVGSQRERQDSARNQFVALDDRPTLGCGDGEDADFRQVEDRVELADAVHAEVADREGAPRQMIGGELAGPRRDSQCRALLADFRQTQRIGPVQHRDDQAIIQGDCDADVDLTVANDRVLLEAGVQPRMPAQGDGHGLGHEVAQRELDILGRPGAGSAPRAPPPACRPGRPR